MPGLSSPGGMPTWMIVEATDPTEYGTLSLENQDYYWKICSLGMIYWNDSAQIKAFVLALFASCPITLARLQAL